MKILSMSYNFRFRLSFYHQLISNPHYTRSDIHSLPLHSRRSSIYLRTGIGGGRATREAAKTPHAILLSKKRNRHSHHPRLHYINQSCSSLRKQGCSGSSAMTSQSSVL